MSAETIEVRARELKAGDVITAFHGVPAYCGWMRVTSVEDRTHVIRYVYRTACQDGDQPGVDLPDTLFTVRRETKS